MSLSKLLSLAKTKATWSDLPSDPAARGKAIATRVHDALVEAGLPRISHYTGGEIRGWTEAIGSTGFSLRVNGEHAGNPLVRGGTRFVPSSPPQIDFHVVVSGKRAGLRYRTWTQRRPEEGDTIELHEPIDAERLAPKIRAVFEGLGFQVQSVRYSGAQMHWDDDVSYNVVTDWPTWIGRAPKSG